jgi:protein TonB
VGTPINLPSTKSEALPAVKPFVQHRAPSKKPESDIKRDYRTTLMLGLILSLGIVILAFRADIQADSDEFNLSLSEQEVVLMEEIQQTEQVERPPPPPRPPVPVEVPDDTILEDEALDLDVTLDMDGAVTDLPPPPPPPVEQVEELPEPEIFVAVEQMPEIIGGDNKVYEYLEYPELARQAGMQGLVIVAIVVDELGIPNSPTIARSAGEVLDRAARDAVLKLRFIPGRQRGRAVKVRMSVPIRFELRFVR